MFSFMNKAHAPSCPPVGLNGKVPKTPNLDGKVPKTCQKLPHESLRLESLLFSTGKNGILPRGMLAKGSPENLPACAVVPPAGSVRARTDVNAA